MLDIVRCSMVRMHMGSTKDMEEVVKIADQKRLEVIYETFRLEVTDQVLQKLKFKDNCLDSTNSINHTQ